MVESNGHALCTDEEPRPVQRFHESKLSSEAGTLLQNGGYEEGRLCRNGRPIVSNAKRPHPFVFRLYPSRWDRIVWYLMAFTLAPIKLCLTVTFLALAWIPGRITVLGLPLQPDKPFSKWRMVFKSMTVFLARCAGFCIGVVSQKVIGKQASSKEAPIIIMGPHMSFLDPLGGALIGLPGAVSIINNAKLPVIGRAFLPGVSVQPMTLKYKSKLDVTSWLDTGPGLLAMITLVLCTPAIGIELEFHPVYHPSEEEKKDPELFARNVRDVMSRHLDLPKTDICYGDLRDLVKKTQPNNGVVHLWKNIITKGFVEMPGKEHFG